MDIQAAINNILNQHIGEENAIPWAELCWQVNPDMDANELRGIIREMRKSESLICSSPHGYYKAKDYDEVKNFTDRLRQPSRDQLHTARVMRDAARRQFAGQLNMFPK